MGGGAETHMTAKVWLFTGLVLLVGIGGCAAAKTYTWSHPLHHDEGRFQSDGEQCRVYAVQMAPYRMQTFQRTDFLTDLIYGPYVANVNAGLEECMARRGYSVFEVPKP